MLWKFEKSILSDLIGCGKHKPLEKKANFPVKKKFWPIFLVFSTVTNLKGQTVNVQKAFWQLLWKT